MVGCEFLRYKKNHLVSLLVIINKLQLFNSWNYSCYFFTKRLIKLSINTLSKEFNYIVELSPHYSYYYHYTFIGCKYELIYVSWYGNYYCPLYVVVTWAGVVQQSLSSTIRKILNIITITKIRVFFSLNIAGLFVLAWNYKLQLQCKQTLH